MEFIELRNADCYARILLKGAELTVLQGLNGKNVLWNRTSDHWNRVAPHLFPIVGRLKEDTYTINNLNYHMSQHGFARDSMFHLTEQTGDYAVFLLEGSEESRQKYPFEFRFEVIYELGEHSLKISYRTTNSGKATLPYSVGGHPGFALNDSLDQYAFHFNQAFISQRRKLEDSYFSGETETLAINGILPLSDALFADDALVFFDPPFQQVTLFHAVHGEQVTLKCTCWESVGFWTKAGAPFICIEPWWGHADHTGHNGKLTDKQGIHLLEPGMTEVYSYTLVLP